MSFENPDSTQIAVLGNITSVNYLPRDRLTDYAICVNLNANELFSSRSFPFEFDSVTGSYVSRQNHPDLDPSGVFNAQALLNSLAKKHASIQFGSRFVLPKYAFKVGNKQQLPVGSSFYHRNLQSGPTYVQLYAVFMDENGIPVKNWKVGEDGSIEVFYEYFVNPNVAASQIDARVTATSSPVSVSNLNNLLGAGSEGTGIAQHLICAGHRYRIDNTTRDSSFVNETFTSRGTAKLSNTDMVQFYHSTASESITEINNVRWLELDGITGALRTVRLTRALSSGLQTYVFAVISDSTSAPTGVTEMLDVLRIVPSIALLDNPIVANPSLEGMDSQVPELHLLDVKHVTSAFKNEYEVGLSNNAKANLYCLRVSSSGLPPLDMGDVIRGRPIFLPPIPQKVRLEPSNLIRETQRFMGQYLHRGLPRGTVGQRLLQLMDILCKEEQPKNARYPTKTLPYTEPLDDRDYNHDVYNLTNLGKEVILTSEPDDTHASIILELNKYFQIEQHRNDFLNEFENKFPGLLGSSFGVGQQGYISDVISSSNRNLGFVVFLDMVFAKEVPASAAFNDSNLQRWRLPAVPIVFNIQPV